MSYEVRVPEALMLADFPAWVKMVWISIRSYQGARDECTAGYKRIGERAVLDSGKPMSKSQVQRACNALIDSGFLVRNEAGNLVCMTGAKVHQECTGDDEGGYTRSQRGVHQESTGGTPGVYQRVHQESTPSKNQQTNNKTNNKTNVSKVFDTDSWQYEFASAHLENLKRLDIAPRSALSNPEKTIQRDADVFDKLHRLDGHEQEEIRRVMRWLFSGSWWITSGNYASAKKLRDKKGDQTYFEKFKIQSLETNGRTSKGDRRSPSTGNNSYAPGAAFARIQSIARAALDPERGPVADTGTG